MNHRAWALVLLALVPGCAVNGLAFDLDERVEIKEPVQNASVDLPVNIRWSAKDIEPGHVFGVFFDSSPMRPNGDLLSLVPEDDPCRTSVSDCPDLDWLTDHHIYLTDQTSLVVDSLPDLRTNDRSKDRHEVAIVLLDGSGKRDGESAFVTEFIVERDER